MIAAVLALVTFWVAPFMRKIMLVVMAAIIAFAALSVTPRTVLDRYKTIFADGGRAEAVQSKESRLELLRASLKVTAQHPIFGVGNGNFVVAYNNERYDAGLSGHWEVTHNAYTQLSSETGVPSLIFYLAVFGVCIKGLLRIRKQTRKLPQFSVAHKCASVLLMSILAYLVSGLFTSNAHEFYLPLLTGFSVALIRATKREMAEAKAPAPAVAAVLPPPRPRVRARALAPNTI
jgi:O-antigen ligase